MCIRDSHNSIFSRVGQLTLYPNPTTQAVFMDVELSGQGTAHLKITDMKGQVHKINTSTYISGINKFELLVANLEPGIYVVSMTLSGSKKSYNGKFVKV